MLANFTKRIGQNSLLLLIAHHNRSHYASDLAFRFDPLLPEKLGRRIFDFFNKISQVSNSRCVCSQREKCGRCISIRAALRPENRPFMQNAARPFRHTHMLRTFWSFAALAAISRLKPKNGVRGEHWVPLCILQTHHSWIGWCLEVSVG
jgi:hypothetical protein